MKDSNYWKEELDARTGDLSDEDKATLEESLNAEKKKNDIKSASEELKLSTERTLVYDIEEFLADTLHYRTEDSSMDVLEIQVKEKFMRVAGKLVNNTFFVEEFYINPKPLKNVIHIEDEPDSITRIEWA